MLVDNTLFVLILAALTLMIFALSIIVGQLFVDSRKESKLRPDKAVATPKTTPHECTHSFGYLSERPTNQQIPSECLNCVRVIECIKALAKPRKSSQAQSDVVPQQCSDSG